MKALVPDPSKVEMDFKIDTTVGMSQEERKNFFNESYSYRGNYAKTLANSDPSPKNIELVDNLTRAIENQRNRFVADKRLFSLMVQNLAIAYKDKID